jgi:hypothetical protein
VSRRERNRYVIHLPIDAGDLTAATRLARTLSRSLDFLPGCDPGETTVTVEGDQATHHRVFCNRLVEPGRRCVLRAAHPPPCHIDRGQPQRRNESAG